MSCLKLIFQNLTNAHGIFVGGWANVPKQEKKIQPSAFSPLHGPECPHKKKNSAFSRLGGPECPHQKKKFGIFTADRAR